MKSNCRRHRVALVPLMDSGVYVLENSSGKVGKDEKASLLSTSPRKGLRLCEQVTMQCSKLVSDMHMLIGTRSHAAPQLPLIDLHPSDEVS